MDKGEPGEEGQEGQPGGIGGQGGAGGAGGKGRPEGGGGVGGVGGAGGAGTGPGLRARLSRPHLTAVDLLCAAGSVAAIFLLGVYVAVGHL